MKSLSKISIVLTIISIFIFFSCQKQNDQPSDNNNLKQTNSYSSEVAYKWIDLQLRFFRTNATPIGGLPPQRYYAYSAIALYESVVPGMPAHQSLSGQ